jgi:hypothetical protein
MDPVHPILPSPPNIAAVTPAPTARGVDRDGRRRQRAEDEREAEEERRRKAEEARAEQPRAEPDDDFATDGPHIDLTA